jgi:hypothetical protein
MRDFGMQSWGNDAPRFFGSRNEYQYAMNESALP